MADSFGSRLRKAVNAFTTEEARGNDSPLSDLGSPTYTVARPDRLRLGFTNDRSMMTSIQTRIGIDAAAAAIRHVRLDNEGHFKENMKSELNQRLDVEANIDQGARAFRQDVVMTVLDKGVAAIVPVDTTTRPENSNAYDILSFRVGEIVEWRPRHVRVSVYNDRRGKRQTITLAKADVAIVENPLSAVMNEPNSTLQRLLRKLSLLDVVDEQSGSGKLDLIIQLPYVIKTEARRQEAEKRRKDIEVQLSGSKYGIAYTDGTERITQLNRPAENNLFKQVEYLTSLLFDQLGLSEEIFNGTASEAAMINYFNRTIEPILAAITEAMTRSFLTKTARSQGQSIEFFREPFKLVPMSQIADLGEKFTRNEILTPNEVRSMIGFKPADDVHANELRNRNMPLDKTGLAMEEGDPAAETGDPLYSEIA